MHISHAKITHFRALQSVSVPLNQFSVLIGENDVGKTSFLHALDKFFTNKKLTDKDDYFKDDIKTDIRIVLSFQDIPDNEEFKDLTRKDGSIVISKIFSFDTPPKVKAILDDQSAVDVPRSTLSEWFSSQSFHFIPVRRDLSVQFSMAKTALLGKTLRAKMRHTLEEGGSTQSLKDIEKVLKDSIDEPKNVLQKYLREQMHNDAIRLGFEELEVDPIEGITFVVKLSDDGADDILIENRGAGTQNNLIIALFRLIADLHVGNYFIFAMEEPENSLHPKAQRQLLSVIQDISKDSQVIVTTHSPVFIDRSKYENNVLLTRTTNGNTITKTFDSSLLNIVRTDLGIKTSDALLKGGGNCALLVEGNTEEDGFPIFMEMLGMSEFKLGIAIIKLGGSDFQKVRNTSQLLNAYDIPCIIVLDNDAGKTVDDLIRLKNASLHNIKEVYCLSKGAIEDYYPLDIVAEVINQELKPNKTITANDFDNSKHGKERLANFKKVMYENGAGDSLEYLKSIIGGVGTKIMKQRGLPVDSELVTIFEKVKAIVEGDL